jgi:hypothetical protein
MPCQARFRPVEAQARERLAQAAHPYGADVVVGLPQRVAPIPLHASAPHKYRVILANWRHWHADC